MVEQVSEIRPIIPERYRVYSKTLYDSGLTVTTGEIYALVNQEDGQHAYRFLANVSEKQADEIIREVSARNPLMHLAKGPTLNNDESLKSSRPVSTFPYEGVGIWQDRGNNRRIINFIQGKNKKHVKI